jgi:adenylylsulfate kinase
MSENVNVVWHPQSVARPRGCVVWLTGLSGCGKSTVANLVDQKLMALGAPSFVLDGDNLRHGLNASPAILREEHGEAFAQRFGLGFAPEDREENIRRVGAVAELFAAAGIITLAAFVSPYRRDRESVRRRVERFGRAGDFIEVYVDAPLSVCEARDPKGLYKQARAGQITNFTGVDAPYEVPAAPELHLDASAKTANELADEVIQHLRGAGKLKSRGCALG